MVDKRVTRYNTKDRARYISARLKYLHLPINTIKAVLDCDGECIKEILMYGEDVLIPHVGEIRQRYRKKRESYILPHYRIWSWKQRKFVEGNNVVVSAREEFNDVVLRVKPNLLLAIKEKTYGNAFVPNRRKVKFEEREDSDEENVELTLEEEVDFYGAEDDSK